MDPIISGFTPLSNRCLIEKIIPPLFKDGLRISSNLLKENIKLGKVVSIGNGYHTESGNFIPTTLKKGQVVFLPEYNGTKIKMESSYDENARNVRKIYEIYKETDILGTVNKYRF